MRLHRFYIVSPIKAEGINSFSDTALIHQLSRVFRLHEGDKAIFFDGTGQDFESEIVTLTKNDCTFRVLETRPVKQHSSRKITLAVSLIKKDNFEWVIQKGTELGVSEFIPLISDRSEKKGFNMERARKIMIEAVEQSGRSVLSDIREPKTFADFLVDEKRNFLVFDIGGAPFNKKDIEKNSQNDIVACIGPEGGWSEKELTAFKEKGASIVKLDTPVLRAETAAVVVSTLFLVD